MDSSIIVAMIGAFISLVTLAHQIYKDKAQNKSAISRAVGFLLLQNIKVNAGECIRRGSITPMELEILEENYELYHTLGGNGFADAMLQQIRKLPIRGNNNEG